MQSLLDIYDALEKFRANFFYANVSQVYSENTPEPIMSKEVNSLLVEVDGIMLRLIEYIRDKETQKKSTSLQLVHDAEKEETASPVNLVKTAISPQAIQYYFKCFVNNMPGIVIIFHDGSGLNLLSQTEELRDKAWMLLYTCYQKGEMFICEVEEDQVL